MKLKDGSMSGKKRQAPKKFSAVKKPAGAPGGQMKNKPMGNEPKPKNLKVKVR